MNKMCYISILSKKPKRLSVEAVLRRLKNSGFDVPKNVMMFLKEHRYEDWSVNIDINGNCEINVPYHNSIYIKNRALIYD